MMFHMKHSDRRTRCPVFRAANPNRWPFHTGLLDSKCAII